MLERDRVSLRKFREEYAAEEAVKQKERERPLREAEAQLQRTSLALANAMRQPLLHGRDPDLEAHPDEVVSELEALVNGERETEWFLIYNPWFYESPENARLLVDYVKRNGRSRSITRELLEFAAKRMQKLGLLKERPITQPFFEQTTLAQTEILTETVTAPPKPETFAGWDIATGKPREFSKFEVDRMSGDEYARTFRLNRSGMLLAGRRLG